MGYPFQQDIDEKYCDNGNNGNIRSVLKMDPSTGALQIPSYIQISRVDHCPLLQHAWGQNWDEVVRLCVTQPWRTLHVTKYSGRTALHLATFDRRCPLRVARALLKANRQMIVVRDSNNYTPLHNVTFFSAATPITGASNHSGSETEQRARTTEEAVATNDMGRPIEGVDTNEASISPVANTSASTTEADDESKRAEAANADAESRSVMSLFCDTAIMVEQELGRARGKQQEEEQLPLLEGTSPLYLAAKKGAPVSILKILLETRSRTNCIAPSTGGEPYWYENNINITASITATGTNRRSDGAKEKKAAPTSFSSPLEILLREDRLRSGMNTTYYRSDAYLLGEEEDGNMLGGRRILNTDNRAPGFTIRTRVREKHSSLHPDEILGAPHLIREMRRLAIDRCREHYCHDNVNEKLQHAGDDRHTDSTFTESQQRCLELWEKCVELLVTAGGGGIPLLMMEEEKDDCASRPLSSRFVKSSAVPYGVLHACVCCKVPVPSLVEIALILFPDQVHKRDVLNEMVPLHHALCTEHKYSYATSNLLTILLEGRASIGSNSVPVSLKTTRTIKKQQQQIPKAAVEGLALNKGKIPELHSLSILSTLNNSNINVISKTISSLHLRNALYLKSTALLSFPSAPNQKVGSVREHNGPIPLVFAIRKGLSMKNVINKLLEADSHESLRTIDLISQLPPFALVATKIYSSKKGEYQQDPSSDETICSAPKRGQHTDTATTSRSSREYPNDIIVAAIGSTINALSSGDGSSEFVTMTSSLATFSSSVVLSSSEASSSSINNRNPKVDDVSVSTYTLDDVYRLLLAHPQVLAQYVVER
jgi:hypothetical protein